MSELDDLLAACVAAPDDDAPRLVWADAIGAERGELVVLQCKLAREDVPPAEAGAMLARVDELLAAHGNAWSGFADTPGVKRCLYRRGFVASVEANVIETPYDALLAAAPLLEALEVKGIGQTIDFRSGSASVGADPLAILAELFAHPMRHRLCAIGIDDAYLFEHVGDGEWDNDLTWRNDEVCQLIASSGRLAGIRAFALHGICGDRGGHDLAGSNMLASIERLAFDAGTLHREVAREVVTAIPNLRALDVGNQVIALRDVVDLLPPSFVELRGGILHDAAVFDRFEAAIAPQIERLAGGFAVRYDRFTRLRCLDVGATAISGPRQGDPEFRRVRDFARSGLPALRELRVFADLSTAELMLIAEAFGPQLACLDLTGKGHLVTPELRACVAGHIRTGPHRKSEAFLEASTNTREPGLGYGIVTLS